MNISNNIVIKKLFTYRPGRVWKISSILFLLKNYKKNVQFYESIQNKIQHISENVIINLEWISNINKLKYYNEIKNSDYTIIMNSINNNNVIKLDKNIAPYMAILLFNNINGEIPLISDMEFSNDTEIIFKKTFVEHNNLLSSIADKKNIKYNLSPNESDVLYKEFVELFNKVQNE